MGGLQRLAHHQGDGRGGVLLGPGRDDRQALETEGDGVGGLAGVGGLGAQPGDLGAPVGRGLGRAQGLVDQPLAGQPPRLDGGLGRAAEPGADGGAVDVGAFQQPFEGALRMLFLDRVPGRGAEVEVESGQDDAALRRPGHGPEHVGGGLDRAGRTGGENGALGRVGVPAFSE